MSTGRIVAEDVATVRERSRIEDVVGEHVTLRPGGAGSLKGLCPFHDERTPSFTIRPGANLWHCFGCGEGGDVITFVMKMDGLPFVEAVEFLAGMAGVALRYEESAGGARREDSGPRRQRLVEANAAAARFFEVQLTTADAVVARRFLADKGFDRQAAEWFGVGYAPQGWTHLLEHLRRQGFTDAELEAAGLVIRGDRGIYDRFRGRVMWPIRDATGATVGFGARRLYDDDQGPKYLNTPETPIYKKAQVLYGIDLARRDIAKTKEVVVVEGYTDVMAAHLAGVTTAVATCGTAFGADHARLVRRLMGDHGDASSAPGAVVFTFDGDAAGQKAALRAFGEDQRFTAQTFVAVAEDGMDPCDLRVAHGDQAIRDLVESRRPLFEFVIQHTIANHDLTTPEGRVAAMRAAAPVVAGIRDAALRPEYTRLLATWVHLDLATVERAVATAPRVKPGVVGVERPAEPAAPLAFPAPDRSVPSTRAEAALLALALQVPAWAAWVGFDSLDSDAFAEPAHRAVADAIRALGGAAAAGDGWAEAVREACPEHVQRWVSELAVEDLACGHDQDARIAHVRGTMRAVRDAHLHRQIADARATVAALPSTDPGYMEAAGALYALEQERRSLRAA